MTTDNTEGLNEIFDKMGYTKNTDFRKDAGRLITDWHNKQVEEVLDRLEQANFAETCEPDCSEVRHARHEGGYAHEQWIDEVIEAERIKLQAGGDWQGIAILTAMKLKEK